MKRTSTIAAAVGAWVLVGCGGSVELSAERLTDTQSALKAAERVGAQSDPQASLYLTYAQEELLRAQALAAEGEGERAALMLERAEADAELAMAMAQEAELRREVRETLERIQSLQTHVQM